MWAYSCYPNHGSEPEIGWNWATRMAANHEVHVLVHPHNRARLLAALAVDPRPNLHVHFVSLPPWLERNPEVFPEHGWATRYALWQLAALRVGAALNRYRGFDLGHHASWLTVDGPTLGWALTPPFVWGPVGGAQRAPLRMRRFLGRGWRVELLRNTRATLSRANPLVRAAATRSTAVLSCNQDTIRFLESVGARGVRFMAGNAIDPSWAPPAPPARPRRARPIVLWIGRLDYRKATGLAIEAFARARQRRDMEMWILGDGHLRPELTALAQRLGVADDVVFRGRLPRNELPRAMVEADLFFFSSLRDTYPDAILEALAWGLPTLSLDHQGVTTFPSEAVVKVPVTTPDGLVADLSAALVDLAGDGDRREAMGRFGWEWVQHHHLWPQRVAEMEEVYASAAGTGTAAGDRPAVAIARR